MKLRIVLSTIAAALLLAACASYNGIADDEVKSKTSAIAAPDAGVDAGPANGLGTSPSTDGLGTSPSVRER